MGHQLHQQFTQLMQLMQEERATIIARQEAINTHLELDALTRDLAAKMDRDVRDRASHSRGTEARSSTGQTEASGGGWFISNLIY